ncbi:amino acid adenylation domain-containing protein [Nocardia panacis]|uniref:Amino acid adenylation domain-containing protein n=1 Tax=Nocardia panacis TaxID=2340916 RepID=A0A3A4KCM9_9NOCA|nr:non-ribosomal peptide synthetase [Nocardia panacis]RJO70062.1 amino acid adenylation domain-containing protein [Nocardia panacis]
MRSNVSKGIEDVYELTPIQQGLLFEQLKRPEAGVYYEQLVLTFDGAMNTDAFQRAWQLVVDRHPILRTSFHWRAEELPLQVVHERAELPLEVLDWQDLSETEQQDRLQKWLDRERIEGFELTKAPLMRISVIQTAPRTWQFVWRLSHLLMDGWSFGLAVTDFVGAYRATCLGHEPKWNPMRPYRDYAAWWHKQDGVRGRDFWERELSDFQPPAPLFLGGSKAPEGEPSHGFVELQLDEIEPGLRELARTNQLTLNTLVQGAWLLVLAHYYGTNDVACGFTMAHRPAELRGSETILGPLIATMPVREKLEMTRAALSWLGDLQVHIAAVRENTTLPLFDVQRVLGRPLTVPLLESSVSYENMPMPDFALAETGMTLRSMRYDGRPHYPITMVIMPGDGMPLRVIYDRGRFSAEAAQRFCDQLREVLTQLVEHPELTLGELSPGGATAAPVSGSVGLEVENRSLPAIFIEHAHRTPDAVALVDGDKRTSYRELDAQSDAIAAQLIEAGIRPGGRVGLHLDRSTRLIAALLGTLKAGAAYVPLEPEQPTERLADILADAAPGAVITSPELAAHLPAFDGVILAEDPADEPAYPALPAIGPEDPAYVLYTSGSTGRPKGVVVTHRNVVSLLAAGRAEFGSTASDVWTFSHSFAFDYSVWEMWGALGNGGRLVIVPRWTVRSPEDFHRLVRTEKVTVCSQTPTLFEHFAAADAAGAGTKPKSKSKNGAAQALRLIFIGGDRLYTPVLRDWITRHGDEYPRVYNLYGVTEAAVVSTFHRVTADLVRQEIPVPIGTALPNQRAYVLDDQGRAVPPGAPGELCVAGAAVAHGYHQRPELAARFGAEPAEPHERMYHTGDLVRLMPDGALHYVGRADTQVKIRGYRVELGEIESVLRTHPAVRSAVAITRQQGAGARLLAYVVPKHDTLDLDDLRAFAARRLPDHMVPTALGRIAEIPTTVGGKIDARALPDLTATDRSEIVEPSTDLERALAGVVAELVGTDRIGMADDFAEIGLHSAHLMRLMVVIRSRWEVSLPLRELFAAPTLRTLSELVSRELA